MIRQLRSGWIPYFVAVTTPFFALAARFLISPYLGDRAPFAFFFIAALLSAAWGGLRPGLVSTGVGAVLATYFVVGSAGQGRPLTSEDVISVIVFCFVGAFISTVSGRLMQSERRERDLRLTFQQTLLGIGEAIISTDCERRVQLMNPVAERLTGWSSKDAEMRPIEDVFRPVEAGSDAPIPNPVEQVINTRQPLSLANGAELVTLDGRRVPIDHTASTVTAPDGTMTGVVLVFRDVSERYQAQQTLAAAEKRSRTILDSISDSFFLLDRDWRFAEVNPAAEAVLRKTASELIGKDFWETYPHLIGTELESRYRAAMRDNTPQRFEFLSPATGIYAAISAFPSAEGLAVYFHDITERKREEADLRRLNEDLKQFTYAASHDLREPLRMITVYSELLTEAVPDELKGRPAMFLANIVAGAQRIGRLIDGLLLFTQMGALGSVKPSAVQAVAALEEAIDLLQLQLEEREARISYGEMPAVLAEPSHLTQIFQNLIANAIKYTPVDTPPRIEITSHEGARECQFCVRDHGIGIDPRFQAQIFQPFKRLHGPEIPGAGIGLATCKRIVEHYGGRIWVASEGQGKGSTFCFSLPMAREEESAALR